MDQNLGKYIFQQWGKETFQAEETMCIDVWKIMVCLKNCKTFQIVENKIWRAADVAEVYNNTCYVLNAIIHYV